MFLRSFGLFTLTMAIVGAAHGADQRRKEKALAFLKEIGGQVCVSKELGKAIAYYPLAERATYRQCFQTLKECAKIEKTGEFHFQSRKGWEYVATYKDGELDFNIDFDLLEKAKKKS